MEVTFIDGGNRSIQRKTQTKASTITFVRDKWKRPLDKLNLLVTCTTGQVKKKTHTEIP